ncbi:hypothetical protein HED60_15025 [Planctomycetales bacterium ZRK34]|nr:hypothetical protein HED60_15025 [Planctomycetales bacterium ZRK34]
MIGSCPQKLLDADTRWVLRLVEFAERGAFPVAGGVMDQSPGFLAVMELVRSEKRSYGLDED